jgi:hypothetical protein
MQVNDFLIDSVNDEIFQILSINGETQKLDIGSIYYKRGRRGGTTRFSISFEQSQRYMLHPLINGYPLVSCPDCLGDGLISDPITLGQRSPNTSNCSLCNGVGNLPLNIWVQLR